MDEYPCECGGTIRVPEPPTDQSLRADAMCSNAPDKCKRLWEFAFSPGGKFLKVPPKLVT